MSKDKCHCNINFICNEDITFVEITKVKAFVINPLPSIILPYRFFY